MKLPIDEVNNFLNTNEMYETIQERLNIDGKVLHTIADTDIEVIAYHDKDLDIKWTVLNNKVVIHDRVAIEDLESTIKYTVQES